MFVYFIMQKIYFNTQSNDVVYDNINIIKTVVVGRITKGSVGNLSFFYPNNWHLTTENNSIGLKPEFKISNLNTDIYSLDFIVTYLKDDNKERLTTSDWIQKNTDSGTGDQKGKDIVVGDIRMYHEFYNDRTSDELGYFSPVVLTITHGTDVYEIFMHEIPTELDPDLSPTDIQAAKEYEQTVNQILQSFKFSD